MIDPFALLKFLLLFSFAMLPQLELPLLRRMWQELHTGKQETLQLGEGDQTLRYISFGKNPISIGICSN
jgi:hypothetical protein